ncbi:hypothetical protein PRIPAC_88413, partial [Pristionchus pacificus]
EMEVDDAVSSITFRTREFLPAHTYVIQVEDGTFFYFTHAAYYKVYVKYDGKEFDAKLPEGFTTTDIGRIGVHENSVYFECAELATEPDRKVYRVTFTAPDTLAITCVRDRFEDEECYRYAMCIQTKGFHHKTMDGCSVMLCQFMYR